MAYNPSRLIIIPANIHTLSQNSQIQITKR